MGRARDAITEGRFPEHLHTFFSDYFEGKGYPAWCVNALRSVGVDLLDRNPNAKVIDGDKGNWDYAADGTTT